MSAFNNASFISELRIVDTATGNTALVGQMGTGALQFGWMAVDNPPLPSQAYGVEAINANLASFGVTTPATVTNIIPYANFSFAGDFWADGLLYFINNDTNNLESIAKDGTNNTVIGASTPQGAETWSGMATDPTTGIMYASATNYGTTSSLYTVDLNTGTATFVGTITNATCLIAIAIDDAGQAYGYDVISDQLLSINLTTGAGTVIGSIGFDANYAQGMDYDSASGQFYMAAFNNGTFQSELRIVDTTTGNTSMVDVIGGAGALLEFGWVAIDGGGSVLPPPNVCDTPSDIPWLSLSPTSGTTISGTVTNVDAIYDSTGYAVGVYTGTLCINSNDPVTPQVQVPVTMTVVPNTPPVANNDAYTTTEDVTLNVAASGVLTNDTDVDGDPLTAVLDTDVSNGTLTLSSNGSFSYTPDADYCGSDSFSYHATDGLIDSNTATVTLNVTCVNDPLQVNAGDDQTADEGSAVTFNGSYSDPGLVALGLTRGLSETIHWDFGDGAVATGTLTPTHIYADNGAYTVTLTITDSEGLAASDILLVTVNNVAPDVQVGGDVTITAGEALTLTGSFTDPGMDDTHTIVWDFGDGNMASGSLTTAYVYADAGTYTATLTVTDDDGGVGSATLTITVEPSGYTIFLPFVATSGD